LKIEIKLAIGNPSPKVGISDFGRTVAATYTVDILPSLELLRVTDYAAVADIGYIELFDKINRNNTNYTRGYDHPMV
jgi:hypothetical protein